jgi:crotonobetainyl-CoA:carnitine CoA-transferase CaiB-like acyl-CoA transferase
MFHYLNANKGSVVADLRDPGGARLVAARTPSWVRSATRARVVFSFGELTASPAPTLGEHTAAVLRDAGIDEATIDAALAELAAGERRMSDQGP